MVDRTDKPLTVLLTAANGNDGTQLEAVLDGGVPIERPLGRPRKRPAKVQADKGSDSRGGRTACRKRGITPRIARRGSESSERLGRYRWVAERTFAWLSRFRRLRIRDERDDEIHRAFLYLGCALICLNFWLHRF